MKLHTITFAIITAWALTSCKKGDKEAERGDDTDENATPSIPKHEDLANDLSEADNVIQSFFAAVKAEDTKAVEAILAPRIKQMIEREKFTLEEYMTAWRDPAIVRVGKAVDISPANKLGIIAEAEIVCLRDGKNVKSTVRVVFIDNQWLWYEK